MASPQARTCREEQGKRERIRSARKDELLAQGKQMGEILEILRTEFPRSYLKAETDERGPTKQACAPVAPSAGPSAAVRGDADDTGAAAGPGTDAAGPSTQEAPAGPSGTPSVADIIRVEMPPGAAEDDGDADEEEPVDGSEESGAARLVERVEGVAVLGGEDGLQQVQDGGGVQDLGGSDDGDSDVDADESEQELHLPGAE